MIKLHLDPGLLNQASIGKDVGWAESLYRRMGRSLGFSMMVGAEQSLHRLQLNPSSGV
jgi:hypothetical protein